jgi:manganese/iron transport system substrate-binding protein
MFRLAPAMVTLFAALLLSACGGDGQAGAPSSRPSPASAGLPMRVGATLPLFADFVREVGADNVDVFSILPSGADPHTYEPNPSDIQRIAEADIIFVNNLQPDLEGSILDAIESNKGQDTRVIPLMANVVSPRAQELGDPEITAAEADDNPHLWLDPLLARAYADVIAEALASEDASNAALYSDNLTRYGQRLVQLDGEIATAVQQIPPENRKLVTPHDAFPHLAGRCGLEIVGFVVPSPGQDPSPRDIADLTRAIRDQGVPAVFTEPQIGADSRLLEQIAADAGVQVCTLYSDTLSDDVTTYIDMMRFNADELLRCLGDGGD